MTNAVDLVTRGYLPRELPPPFTSASLGAFVATGWNPPGPPHPMRDSFPVKHNLFRWGALRRELQIPSPLKFVPLCRLIEHNWAALNWHCSQSPMSISTPVPSMVPNERAILPRFAPPVLTQRRSHVRATSRYIVRADISRCYPSIYTHTLEWAMHTKAAVKLARLPGQPTPPWFWARQLDQGFQRLQGNQTVGIPIGPDPSLIAAEVLLTRIDLDLVQRLGGRVRAVRRVDDYELGFRTLAEAEYGLAALQGALTDYELALNPSKTKIIELPEALEPRVIRELRRRTIRSSGTGQRGDLVELFDFAFSEVRNSANDGVFPYVMGIASNVPVIPSNWETYQSLLLQAVVVEPGVIRQVLSELLWYQNQGSAISRMDVADSLEAIIVRHAPLGHGSEVAWAIWAHIELRIPLSNAELIAIEATSDPIVALVALDANQLGLVVRQINTSSWSTSQTIDGLYSDSWLLSYEADIKGWIQRTGPDYIATDPGFLALRNAGVSFYNQTVITPNPPQLTQPSFIPSGGGGGSSSWS